MKTKSKKQDDEGSTQSNASRYDFSTVFPTFLPYFCFLWLFTLSSLVDHLCVRLPHAFAESAPLPRMTLPLFNSHTLIFVPFLRLTSDSWACLIIGHRMYVANSNGGESHLSPWQRCQWFVTYIWCPNIAKYYDLVWQVAAALHHFTNLPLHVLILETLLCFRVIWWTIYLLFHCFWYLHHIYNVTLHKLLQVILDTGVFILMPSGGLCTLTAFWKFKKNKTKSLPFSGITFTLY